MIVDPARLADTQDEPAANATFAPLPAALNAKTAAKLDDQLAAWAYRAAPLTLWSVKSLDLTSTPDETEAAFRARVAHAAREARDAAVEASRKKCQPKLDALAAKQRTAADRVAREKAQAQSATADTAISVGASVLGALFGGRRSGASKVASAARSVSRTAQQRGDVTRATEAAAQLDAQEADLRAALEEELAKIRAAPEPEVETVTVTPKKADIAVTGVAIYWLPQ
jgi:hypothetical protein